MTRYKKLMKVLLNEMFKDENVNDEMIQSLIIGFAYKDKLVEPDEFLNFSLTDKGEKLIEDLEKCREVNID